MFRHIDEDASSIEALARDGFTGLSAAETTTSMGKGDAASAGPPPNP